MYSTLILISYCILFPSIFNKTKASFDGNLIFSADYDKTIPPSRNEGPLEVSLSIFVQAVAPILTSEMEFGVNMRWTMTWNDPRISFNNITDDDEDCFSNYKIVESSTLKSIWIPDPYIINAKYSEIKSFDKPLSLLRIYENHTLSYTFILNSTISCEMQFQYYPMDLQTCPITIQSYAYDSSKIKLVWNKELDFKVGSIRLIQFMVMESPSTLTTDFYVPLQGNVTQLIATFRFERFISNHFAQTIFPCSLVVMLSWCSFWLELDVTSARGYLLMASILTLEIQLKSFETEFPQVAYIKAVDIWIFGCIFFVFCALLEFVMVKVLYSLTLQACRENGVYSLTKVGTPPLASFWLWQELKEEAPPPYRKRRLGSVVLSGRSVATTHLPIVDKKLFFGKIVLSLVWSGGVRRRVLWREIDHISKYMFPPLFLLFLLSYWTVLLIHSYSV